MPASQENGVQNTTEIVPNCDFVSVSHSSTNVYDSEDVDGLMKCPDVDSQEESSLPQTSSRIMLAMFVFADRMDMSNCGTKPFLEAPLDLLL